MRMNGRFTLTSTDQREENVQQPLSVLLYAFISQYQCRRGQLTNTLQFHETVQGERLRTTGS